MQHPWHLLSTFHEYFPQETYSVNHRFVILLGRLYRAVKKDDARLLINGLKSYQDGSFSLDVDVGTLVRIMSTESDELLAALQYQPIDCMKCIAAVAHQVEITCFRQYVRVDPYLDVTSQMHIVVPRPVFFCSAVTILSVLL